MNAGNLVQSRSPRPGFLSVSVPRRLRRWSLFGCGLTAAVGAWRLCTRLSADGHQGAKTPWMGTFECPFVIIGILSMWLACQG
jgi:hypothetical protein